MHLYEIDQRIASLCDPDTGEVLDQEAMDSILMEREEKIENIACAIKNMQAETKAIQEEEKNLYSRRTALQARAEKMKEYLQFALQGESFKSPRVQVSFRKTERLEIDPEQERFLVAFLEAGGYTDCLKTGETVVFKDKLKRLMKSGVQVPFVKLESNLSMGVK